VDPSDRAAPPLSELFPQTRPDAEIPEGSSAHAAGETTGMTPRPVIATRPAGVPVRPPSVLVPIIHQQLDAATEHAEHATAHQRAVGQLLLEAKASLPHGTFKRWIAQHFPLSYAQATRYMRMASPKVARAKSLRGAERDPATRRQVHRPRRPRRVEGRGEDAIRAMAYAVIDAGYRVVAAKMHPDKPGGSTAQMQSLNRCREVLVQCIQEWDGGPR
jgi:hypothetical protein